MDRGHAPAVKRRSDGSQSSRGRLGPMLTKCFARAKSATAGSVNERHPPLA